LPLETEDLTQFDLRLSTATFELGSLKKSPKYFLREFLCLSARLFLSPFCVFFETGHFEVCRDKKEPPPAIATIAPIPKTRRSRRVQRCKSWGATSVTCGGRSWKKLAGFGVDTDSVEDVLSASGAECLSSVRDYFVCATSSSLGVEESCIVDKSRGAYSVSA
jgi:hypothetical protein